MSSTRPKTTNQPAEKPDLVIPFNSRAFGTSWHVNTLAADLRYRDRQAQAIGTAFNFTYDLKDSANLSRVNRNLNRFFQQQLTSTKPYYEIMKHVFYAGPLEQLDVYIRENPRVLLETFNINNMQGTLVELATIGLDQTIMDNDGRVLSEGTKDKLLQLHEELERQGKLPPGSHAIAIEKAKLAHLQEKAEEKDLRETKNVSALEQLFDAFIGDARDTAEIKDKKITTAIATFKEFMKSLKQQMTTNGMMKTNQYHVNLIHLVACAFDILSRRGKSLAGHWYGALSDRFCFEVLGGAIQTELPPRARQLLRAGIYNLFHQNQQIIRDLDVNGILFKSFIGPSATYSLGHSFFYDDLGCGGAGHGGAGRRGRRHVQAVFISYYSNVYHRPNAYATTRSLDTHNLVGAPNTP